MKIKTQDLIGPALDWAVCIANEETPMLMRNDNGTLFPQPVWIGGLYQREYHKAWGLAGPLIEHEGIGIGKVGDGPLYANPWLAARRQDQCDWAGPTPLVAAMRCFVASKLGDEVDVPKELMK